MRFTFKETGVRVTDLDAALRFYTEGLGMRVTKRVDVPETGGVFVKLQTEDERQQLELNWYPEGSRFATPYTPGEALDHLAFIVEDGTLEDAVRHLEKHGGKLVIEPFTEMGWQLAYVDGPDGHTMELSVPPRDGSTGPAAV